MSNANAAHVRIGSTASAEPERRPRQLAASAVGTYALNIGIALATLGNVLITARYLGPLGRGQVAFVSSIAVVTSTVAGLGIDQATVNMASVQPGARRALATNAVAFAGIFGVAAAGAALLLTHVAPASTGHLPSALLWLAVGAVPFLIARTNLGAFVEADYRFALSSTARLIAPVSAMVVNGLLAVLGLLTATSASAAWVAGQLLGLALLVHFVARRSVGFGSVDAGLARRMLSFGVKAHVSRVMNMANYRLDQWFVGALAGARELGLYSVAVACSEVLFLLPTALAKVQRPVLVRSERLRAARRGAANFRIAILLSLPGAAALIIAAPTLCAAVFGASFDPAIDDLRVLVAGAFGVVAVKLLGDALIAQRRPMLGSAAVGVGFAFTVVLDVLLIPPLGGLGAAIASTIAYSAAGITAGALFVRVLGGGASDLVPRATDVKKLADLALRLARRRRRTMPRPSTGDAA